MEGMGWSRFFAQYSCFLMDLTVVVGFVDSAIGGRLVAPRLSEML